MASRAWRKRLRGPVSSLRHDGNWNWTVDTRYVRYETLDVGDIGKVVWEGKSDRSGSGLCGGTASADRCGEFAQQRVGLRPVDTGIGDALSVGKGLAGNEPLRARNKIALDHDTDDVAVAARDLAGHVMAHDGLAGVVLVAVGVAAVDHDARLDSSFLHGRDSFRDAVCGVVDLAAAAAQDDVRVAGCPW